MKKNERLLVIALVASISLTTFSCDGDTLDISALSNESQLTPFSVAGNIIKGDFFGEGDAAFQQEANEVLAELLRKITTDDEKHRYVKKYPDFYGGAYITDQGRLVVFIHGDFEEGVQQVKNYVNDRGITDYVSCMYSFQELTDIMNNMNDRFETLPKEIKQNIVMYYIKDDQNKVIVSLRNNTLGIISDFQKKVVCHPAIEYINGNNYVANHTRNQQKQGWFNLDSLLVHVKPGGGFFIFKNSIVYNASWAFRARMINNSSVKGMVTASHVLRMNDSVYIRGNYAGHNNGDVYNYEADAAFVRVGYADSTYNSSYGPIIFHLPGPLYSLDNELYQWGDTVPDELLSTETSVPGVGTVINKRGAITYRTTGVVLSTNYSGYIYNANNDSIYVSNRMSASMTSNQGDSGGIIYTYISSTNTRYTVGVLSGNKGTSLTVFTKADVALNSLGLERY